LPHISSSSSSVAYRGIDVETVNNESVQSLEFAQLLHVIQSEDESNTDTESERDEPLADTSVCNCVGVVTDTVGLLSESHVVERVDTTEVCIQQREKIGLQFWGEL